MIGAHVAPTVDSLAGALREEERLLRELIAVLQRQRSAIAADDLESLDDAVFGTHRVLLTLGEARRRRQALNRLLGEGDDLSVDALLETFGGEPPAGIRAAIDGLVDAGRALHREIDLNQRVLRIAIDAGDQLVRTLCGVPAADTYRQTPAPAPAAAIFDRRI